MSARAAGGDDDPVAAAHGFAHGLEELEVEIRALEVMFDGGQESLRLLVNFAKHGMWEP